MTVIFLEEDDFLEVALTVEEDFLEEVKLSMTEDNFTAKGKLQLRSKGSSFALANWFDRL